MKKIIVLLLMMMFNTSINVHATVVTYTDLALFNSVAHSSIVVDFESVYPKDTVLPSVTSNGITFTGLQGAPYPNVWITSPDFFDINPFSPFNPHSSILVANGNEDFFISLSNPTHYFGFDTYLNGFGPATVEIFSISGSLGVYQHIHDPTQVGFFGVTSDEMITGVRFTTVRGSALDTGIDNIRTAVPEPSTMLLFGSALAGLAVTRRILNTISKYNDR